MFHVLGFRHFHLFGFDCNVPNLTDEEKKELLPDSNQPKYLQVELHGHHFWTTGELLAMAQDCEKLFSRPDVDMNITFHKRDISLASEVFEASLRKTEPKYTELLDGT